MNFDEKMAEEYEENAEYIEIDDYGHKVYGSLDIEQAFLDALRKGSQLDKVYDTSENKWVNRHSELEKKYDTCLREKLEKEADDYAEKHAFRVPYDGSNKFYNDVDLKASKEGYIAGAEPREKLIAKLEEQNKNQAESLGVTLLEEENKAKRIKDLEKENSELKKNYEDSLIAYSILKEKIGVLSKPSPVEAMQDALITIQKEANKKQRDQLSEAKHILSNFIKACEDYEISEAREKAEQFLKENM